MGGLLQDEDNIFLRNIRRTGGGGEMKIKYWIKLEFLVVVGSRETPSTPGYIYVKHMCYLQRISFYAAYGAQGW